MHSARTSWISVSVSALLKDLALPLIEPLKAAEIITKHSILSFILWHLQNVFINIRGEGLGAPSRLYPARRCSGVHDVGVTSAPTGPHLTFTVFCLETARRSVPVEADCPDPCLCRASRRIHNSYWFPPTDFIIHSDIVPSPVDKSSSFPCMRKCMNLCRMITKVQPSWIDFMVLLIFLWLELSLMAVWESEGSSRKKSTHLKWVCTCKSPRLIVVKLACSARCWKEGMPHFMECCAKGTIFPLKIWVT